VVSELYKNKVLPLPVFVTNSPPASRANARTFTVSENPALRVTVVSEFKKYADEMVEIGT